MERFQPTAQIRCSISFISPSARHRCRPRHLAVSDSLSTALLCHRLLFFLQTLREKRREEKREMLLGKRPRPPMRRTTSMTEFAADLGPLESNHQPSDQERAQQHQRVIAAAEGVDLVGTRYVAAVATPRGGSRRSSVEFTAVEPAPFLRACSLCNRRLGPGRDTFMYRGDTAFCSLECRQQQMNLDERKEKCSMTSMKKDAPPPTTTAASESSNSSETMAVA